MKQRTESWVKVKAVRTRQKDNEKIKSMMNSAEINAEVAKKIKINSLDKKKLLLMIAELIAFNCGINIIAIKKFIKKKLKVKDFFENLSLEKEVFEISNLTLKILNKLKL